MVSNKVVNENILKLKELSDILCLRDLCKDCDIDTYKNFFDEVDNGIKEFNINTINKDKNDKAGEYVKFFNKISLMLSKFKLILNVNKR